MAATDVKKLADQVEALTPANKLRLAAGLIEAKRYDVAERIVSAIAAELAAVVLLRHPK